MCQLRPRRPGKGGHGQRGVCGIDRRSPRAARFGHVRRRRRRRRRKGEMVVIARGVVSSLEPSHPWAAEKSGPEQRLQWWCFVWCQRLSCSCSSSSGPTTHASCALFVAPILSKVRGDLRGCQTVRAHRGQTRRSGGGGGRSGGIVSIETSAEEATKSGWWWWQQQQQQQQRRAISHAILFGH